MNKCYVALKGGIGNQLFQIATGYQYCKDNNFELLLDHSKWHASQGSNPSEYKDSILSSFAFKKAPDGTQVYTDDESVYKEIPKFNHDIILDGYFQTKGHIQEDTLDEFKDLLILPKIKEDFITESSVIFHIRMGDYLKFSHVFGNLESYFHYMFELYKDYDINVVTDSMKSVMNVYQYKYNILSTPSELHDMAFLANHPKVVCSNSSFSWWGSLLGRTDKTIHCPNIWINNVDPSTFYRKDMIIYDR